MIKKYYNNRCAYCLKTGVRLTKDHMLAKSKGGETTSDNIAPACDECNQLKEDKPIWVMLGL
jgi:5-methylcytosine-specific restriction endonuclease McrA